MKTWQSRSRLVVWPPHLGSIALLESELKSRSSRASVFRLRQAVQQRSLSSIRRNTKGENKMRFQGALVREQGVTFGIVVVKPHVLHNPLQAETLQRFGRQAFGPVPIILMAQDSRGIPTYSGRSDIVRFLANIPMSVIPWKQYSVSN